MSLLLFLIFFSIAIAMAVGRFLLLTSIKSDRPLNSYGFLISLLASLGAALIAHLYYFEAFSLFYVFLASIYGLYWVLSGFGFKPCPALLKPGVSRSARWVLFPLCIASILAIAMTFLGNDLGAHYGAWLSLSVACLAFCGLYRKGLSHRAYGLLLLSSLICMSAAAGPALASMFIVIQLPWFLPAIRRPAVEANTPKPANYESETSEPEALEPGVPPLLIPEEPQDTETTETTSGRQTVSIMRRSARKIRDLSFTPQKTQRLDERVEPSIETLAEIPDLDR